MSTNFPKSLLSVGIGLILMVKMPMELLHAVVWTVQHVYMLFEFILDELIGHFFDASRRTTQIAVFYLMVILGGLTAIWLFHRIAKWCAAFTDWCREQKRQIAWIWETSSILKKTQLISGVSMGSAVLVMFAF
ncbi:hypothetical protein GO003_002560 [Methylicorpusculum oleiharenae]|uniref:hypothetical protein n=1 Tax=Methylicorpusculum oleiharenae TaxID=1338687 RepID=UPI0013596B06|nr:hypothetical protein [Methylicorpusculum oleiharenae]MCD2449270.1 hypothetical protein [Methylicorpusculum oleiharenae]